MQFSMDDTFNTVAKMKVIGIGGAGGNAVNRMVQSGLEGIEFISVNTDAMALDNNLAGTRIQIGDDLTGGLGAGANPKIGMEAMQADRDKIKAELEGSDIIFITAGMGGGTGTGAAPVVAEVARELGILSVGVVTSPFGFEGPIRARNAKAGLEALRNIVDTIIVIPNEKLLSVIEKNTTFREAFKMADEVLTSATRGISDIILKNGDIQVDFADVKSIMSQGGDALMGTGIAKGENRAIQAADIAIHSPLLEEVSIVGATEVLVNITGGENLGMLEIKDAMDFIYEAVGNDTSVNIIFGTVVNPELKDEVAITVIATGFGREMTSDAMNLKLGQPEKLVVNEAERTPAIPQEPVIERIDRLDYTPQESQASQFKETADYGQQQPQSDLGYREEPLTTEIPVNKMAASSQLGPKEGKFREGETDVDYETPAFLRYSSD